MKATGAIWGFALALIPVFTMLVPVFRDNGFITATVAATAIGVLNLVLKIAQERDRGEPSGLSRSVAVEREATPAWKRVLLG